MDASGTVNQDDVVFLVENVLRTFMGDATLDGKVDAMDLNRVGINCEPWTQPVGGMETFPAMAASRDRAKNSFFTSPTTKAATVRIRRCS